MVKNRLGAACPGPPEPLSGAEDLCLLEVCSGGHGVCFSGEERVASLLCGSAQTGWWPWQAAKVIHDSLLSFELRPTPD